MKLYPSDIWLLTKLAIGAVGALALMPLSEAGALILVCIFVFAICFLLRWGLTITERK